MPAHPIRPRLPVFRRAALAILAAAALPAWLVPAPGAQAQIRQCEGADGGTVFTDRSCGDVGAAPAAPGATPTSGRPGSGCARDVRQLVWEVSAAIDLGDVNRLAGVYHWTGMSGRNGNVVMDRLQALVAQPLLQVTPVVHRPPPRPWSVLDDHEPERPAPMALQLEQLQPDGGSRRTTFDLHEHFGCVWIAG